MMRCRAKLGPVLSLVAALAVPGPAPRAAETLRAPVTILPTGDAAIDQALAASSTLLARQKDGDVAPLTLVTRARTDATRFEAALRSLGHYQPRISVSISGRSLDQPDLLGQLENLPLPAGATAVETPVEISVVPGEPTRLGRITLEGDSGGRSVALQPDATANASDVLRAVAALRSALLADGHAFAKVDPPVADYDARTNRLDITIKVSAGPRVAIGAIAVTGATGLDEAFIRRHLTLESGTAFDPAVLEAARDALIRLPVIASARVVPDTGPDSSGRVPVTIAITERPPRVITAQAAYSTDRGVSTSIGWTHRNLFGGAETLALMAAIEDIGATAAARPGYRAGATLTLPDWRARQQTLSFSALAVNESLDAYDRTAALAGTQFGWQLSKPLRATIGLGIEAASITQNGVARHYNLLQAPLGLRFDSTTSPTDPASGVKAEALITPVLSQNGGRGRNTAFVIAQIAASGYFDLAHSGRTVLALRGITGVISGAERFDVPPDQRFYAGGSGTVRGYRYQSLGPQFASTKPQGGQSLAAGTVELRQRIGDDFGAAVFVDAGQTGTGSNPFAGRFRVGLGAGVRYYTAIGPIRVDVAVPLSRPRGGDIGQFYVGLGQAF